MSAHCTCMAGLGETCSYIAALLFGLEAGVKLLKEKTCTSLPCSWSDASGSKIEFAEGNKINF